METATAATCPGTAIATTFTIARAKDARFYYATPSGD